MARRGSRWQGSVLTFGPVGRLVCTALVFGVLWWFIFRAGPWGLAGMIIWGVLIAPMVLRQVWRPAVLPHTEESLLEQRLAREIAADGPARPANPALDPDEKPPTRW